MTDPLPFVESDAGLRERMEALADEFDAKGRRGAAFFGADVGDTIRLWIERDPRSLPETCDGSFICEATEHEEGCFAPYVTRPLPPGAAAGGEGK